MKESRVKECRCPSCDKLLDSATNVTGDDGPGEGDITVCLTCGHIMAFTADLAIRSLTDVEMHEIAGDPRLIKIQRARAMALKK